MTTPADRKYSPTHQWVSMGADGIASVGITFHAQEQLGDVVFVQYPDPGRQLVQGEACGVIESVKAAADVYTPLSGEVVAANTELDTAPQKLNDAPWETWLFKLRPSERAELDALLDAAAYDKVAEADKA
jgi:glycine cleavage system H protein